MHPRSNPRSRRCRPACIAGGTAPFPCRGGAGPRAGDSEPADITGASVFRPRRALDMHARSPAEISFVRAFGYYLRGSDASVRLLANAAFLRGDRCCDQSDKRFREVFVRCSPRTGTAVANVRTRRRTQACFRTQLARHAEPPSGPLRQSRLSARITFRISERNMPARSDQCCSLCHDASIRLVDRSVDFEGRLPFRKILSRLAAEGGSGNTKRFGWRMNTTN